MTKRSKRTRALLSESVARDMARHAGVTLSEGYFKEYYKGEDEEEEELPPEDPAMGEPEAAGPPADLGGMDEPMPEPEGDLEMGADDDLSMDGDDSFPEMGGEEVPEGDSDTVTQVDVASLVDAIAQAVEAETGVPVERVGAEGEGELDDLGGEPEDLGGEPPMDGPPEDLGGEPEDLGGDIGEEPPMDGPPPAEGEDDDEEDDDEEKLVQEVLKRVAQRLLKK